MYDITVTIKAYIYLEQKLRTKSESTKTQTYRQVNPMLSSPQLLIVKIPEYVRIIVIKVRISVHNLKVETSKWA